MQMAVSCHSAQVKVVRKQILHMTKLSTLDDDWIFSIEEDYLKRVIHKIELRVSDGLYYSFRKASGYRIFGSMGHQQLLLSCDRYGWCYRWPRCGLCPTSEYYCLIMEFIHFDSKKLQNYFVNAYRTYDQSYLQHLISFSRNVESFSHFL